MNCGRVDDDVIDVSTAFGCPWLTVREARVRRGSHVDHWYYVDHPGTAVVLPVTVDGQLALVRAWRVAVRKWCIEAPAGRIEPEERPVDAARRELREEIGGDCTTLVPLGKVFPSSGSSNELMHLYVGFGVRAGSPHLDPGERLELNIVETSRAVAMARDGLIEDSPTSLAILMACQRGLLDRGGHDGT